MAFKRVAGAFEKSSNLYGPKIIRPLKVLLLRVLKEGLGFIDLHVYFLSLCLKFSVPREAIAILEYPALFKHATKTIIAEFAVKGCDIYIKLRKYKEALEQVKSTSDIEFIDSELETKIIMREVILRLALGHSVTN
jgi:hypothetical protein